MNDRATRRRHARHAKRSPHARRMAALRKLQATHGRIALAYDTDLDSLDVVDSSGDTDLVALVWPEEDALVARLEAAGLENPFGMELSIGVVEPYELVPWIRGIELPPAMVGTKILVWACCEHIRDSAADELGFDMEFLSPLFAERPTGWLVWSTLLHLTGPLPIGPFPTDPQS